MLKCNIELKTLLLQDFSEPQFYGDLVYKFRKIAGNDDFSYYFRKMIARYLKTGLTIDVLCQAACLVIYSIKLNNFSLLFN